MTRERTAEDVIAETKWPVLVCWALGISAINGIVGYVLWGWFAVPLGAPAIGPVHVLGLMLLVGHFLPSQLAMRKVSTFNEVVVHSITKPAAAYLVGLTFRLLLTLGVP